MAKHYYRFQNAGHSLADMQKHVSGDGGDGMGEVGGVCACESVNELRRNTVYSAAVVGAEVVVIEGDKLADIYDGVRVYPTKVVARFSASEFDARMWDIEEQYG